MEGEDIKTGTGDLKTYVKPTVTKHMAASLVVGSGCGSCGTYVASNGNSQPCVAGLVTNVNTYCYYH
jgi:hypothetical protein